MTTGYLQDVEGSGTAIQKQAYEASISVDTMKQAFTDVLSALTRFSAHKQEALPRMRETIGQFRELAETGETADSATGKGQKLGL